MTKTTKAVAMLGMVAALGVAALPLSSYAADELTESEIVGVTLTIEDTLEISADRDNDTNKVDLGDGTDTDTVTVTVETNNKTGYILAIKGSASPNATSLTSEHGDQIVPGSGTFDAPALLSTTVSQWGYAVNNENENNTLSSKYAGFSAKKYAAVTAGDVTIANVSQPTGEEGDDTEVTFAASIKDGQPAGTYEGQVTFTATNNTITD